MEVIIIPHKDIEERKANRRQHYKDNLLIMRERRLKDKKRKRKYVDDYKLSKGCSVCGYKKCAAALDFHHNGDKEFDIGNARNSMGLKKLKAEMDKCEVLRRNCHAEWHEKERLLVR